MIVYRENKNGSTLCDFCMGFNLSWCNVTLHKRLKPRCHLKFYYWKEMHCELFDACAVNSNVQKSSVCVLESELLLTDYCFPTMHVFIFL